MKLKLFSLLLVVALLLCGCGPKAMEPSITTEAPNTTTQAATNINIPDFIVFDSDAAPHSLSDYIGKPIVLNFWGSWCGPCKSEMPGFQAAYEDLGDQVQFLMIDVGETPDEAEAFLAQAGYTFPVLFDVNGHATYAYQISAVPATFFISAEGEIVDAHVGAMAEADLRTAIEAILP